MPCRLHIPVGRVGNKTKEVVIGVAMPGRVFHNNLIPAKYAKVLVREITDMACIHYPLDHVTPEGIMELGEVVNQFILWNRCEIILDDTTIPQNQLMSPLSQIAMSKGNEALLLKDNEASHPLSPKEMEASTLPTSSIKVIPQ
jgi:hypothetical protein